MDIDQLDVIKKDNFITKDLQLLYCEDSIEKGKQLEAYLESDDISRDIRYDKTKWDALYKICQQEKMYIKQYVLIKVMEYFRWCDKAFKNKEFIQLIKNAFIEYGDFKTVAMNTYSLYNDEYSYSISRYVSLMDYIMFLYFLQRRIFIQKNYEELKNKYTEINWEEFITSKKMTTYICNNAHKYRNCYQDLIDICNYYILNKVSISDYLFTKEYLWDIDYIKNTILKSEFLDNENNYIKIMDIDIMSGIDFEEFLGKLFRRMGYESVVTPASGDYGIDLLVKKDNQTVAVQAKRYSESNVVGIKAVQEALGGKSYYKADKAMVITTSSFTKNAQNLAKENGIILWDRHELKKKIDDLF